MNSKQVRCPVGGATAVLTMYSHPQYNDELRKNFDSEDPEIIQT